MSSPVQETDVLIVGAGPTGLVLALCLQRLGVRFRIVDKAPGPGLTSRALVVHARTLEFYRMLGLVDRVIAAAQKVGGVNLWVGGRVRGHMTFGDIGARLSKFPFSLIFPQDEHEELLQDVLHERGAQIERSVEVTGLHVDERGALATLRSADGALERCRAQYVAGCDGARSIVRETLGIGLPGGTYEHLWYVADAQADGPLVNEQINISMDSRDVLAIMPMKGRAIRLVGQAAANADGAPPAWDSVSTRLLRELRTQVRDVRWFSTYHVHHRVADAFAKGRGFLLGDAAHLHSPVGGQGMNTGIGDAVNLAWKIADVVRGRGAPSLLDTYEPERRAFAELLVATTDRVFSALNGVSVSSQVFRTVIAPAVLPALLRLPAGRTAAFRLLSQIAIEYRNSTLSKGVAGRVHGGDRLPWLEIDNFAPLDAFAWQAHVYGEASDAMRALCDARRLPLHVFAWQPSMRDVGFGQNAMYVLRPDGHVAEAIPSTDT